MERATADQDEAQPGCPPHDVRTDVVPLWSAPKDRGGVQTGQVVIRYCTRCPWEDIHKCAFGDDGGCAGDCGAPNLPQDDRY